MRSFVCSNCKWWKRDTYPNRDYGECMVFPPTIVGIPRSYMGELSGGSATQSLPRTANVHFCSLHEEVSE